MIGHLFEISLGVLILIGFIRICAFVRWYSSHEEVMHLLGDALSLKIGHEISQREGDISRTTLSAEKSNH